MEESPSKAVRMFLAMDRMRRAWKGINFCPELNKSQFWTLFHLYRGSWGREAQCRRKSFRSNSSFLRGRGESPDRMTLSALAQIMQQSMPAVSQRISRLEEMGYVTRVPDSQDKRIVWISLSEPGREEMKSACARMTETMNSILNVLGDDEIEFMFQIFCKLADAMETQRDAADSRQAQNHEKERKSC